MGDVYLLVRDIKPALMAMNQDVNVYEKWELLNKNGVKMML